MRRGCRCRGRIIPAYAGSTPPQELESHPLGDHPRIRGEHAGWRRGWGRLGLDHPRIRGEHLGVVVDAGEQHGSSPHTRGALARRRCLAGPPTDHPRIRGEHVMPSRNVNGVTGSSPHTRGAPARADWGGGCRGIIPAYAGSTMAAYRLDLMTQDHPRIRGEHRLSGLYTGDGQGSSPHTRGAHLEIAIDPIQLGIIPAYAGSTRSGEVDS